MWRRRLAGGVAPSVGTVVVRPAGQDLAPPISIRRREAAGTATRSRVLRHLGAEALVHRRAAWLPALVAPHPRDGVGDGDPLAATKVLTSRDASIH